MKSWVTKTAGWLAIAAGIIGFITGMVDAGTAGMLITNGMGYIGIDRKFKRMGWNQPGTGQ